MSEIYSFATDIHGNINSVDRFLAVSKKERVNHVIFGGDIAPKRMAIALADNQGFPVGRGDINGQHTKPADELERSGSILFHSPLTSEQLKRAIPLAHSLATTNALESIIWRGLTDDELSTMREILIPIIKEYLSGRDGSVLLQHYINKDVLSGMQWLKGLNLDEICNYLLLECNFSNLSYHQKFNDEREKKRAATGDPDASDELYRQKVECMHIAGTSIKHVLAECLRAHMPWHTWRYMEQTLDHHAVEGQIRFMENLLKRITAYRSKLAATFSIILGNDDAIELVQLLDDAAQAGKLIHATNRVVDLNDHVQMLGYANVPPIAGITHNTWFREIGLIESDLMELQQHVRTDALLLANIHCPPSASSLSLGRYPNGETDDFGSTDVRAYIDRAQPEMLLTGHIHEPYTLNGGKIAERSGKTIIVNPGASEITPRIAVGYIGNDQPTLYEKE